MRPIAKGARAQTGGSLLPPFHFTLDMSSRGRPKASTSRLPPAPPSIAVSRPRRKSTKKGKERAPAQETTLDSSDSEDEWKPPEPEKGKGKGNGKRVRIASPSSADSDAQEDYVSLSPSPTATGRYRAKGADEGSSDDELQSNSYWDPRLLPFNGAQRRTRDLKRLEYGGYRTALYDTAVGEMDLGRILLEWEGIKRGRAQEEQVVAPDRAVERLTRARQGRSRSGTPVVIGDLEELPGTPAASVAGGGEQETLPFPSALSLDILARWPIRTSLLESKTPPISDAIWSLISSTTTKLERLSPALRKPHGRRARPRSAYEQNGPLATTSANAQPNGHQSASEEDSEDANSASDSGALSSHDDDIDPAAPPPALQPAFDTLSSTLDLLLTGLVEEIPAGPMPPLDLYTQQIVRVRPPPAQALGWEKVLKVVRGLEGIPDR